MSKSDSAPKDAVELAHCIVEMKPWQGDRPKFQPLWKKLDILAKAVIDMHAAAMRVDGWISEMEKEKHWMKQRLETAEAEVTVLRRALVRVKGFTSRRPGATNSKAVLAEVEAALGATKEVE